MTSDSAFLDTVFEDIKKILLENGWDKPLLLQTLENRYKLKTQRELKADCLKYGLSIDEFIVRSEIFRLFLKFGKTHVYLAPEKLEQPLPMPTVGPQPPPKRFKRKKKGKRDKVVVKFKANPWGSFEPVETNAVKEPQELKPRPAFDMYSDDEDEECELVEVSAPVSTKPEPPKETPNPPELTIQHEKPSVIHNNNYNQSTSQNLFNVKYPPTPFKQTTYISSQQIDGPTMLDFQEDNNPGYQALQDLSLYRMRQNEYNHFNYNDLPGFRRCINFRQAGGGNYHRNYHY